MAGRTSKGASHAVAGTAKSQRLPVRSARRTRSSTEKPLRAVKEECDYRSSPELDEKSREVAVWQLKQFDLNPRYGPCVGISRLKRWERAERLKLNPPIQIKNILSDRRYREAIEDIDENLWHNEL